MSKIKIHLVSAGYGHSMVYIDGKFAYNSNNSLAIEQANINELIELIPIENAETTSVYTANQQQEPITATNNNRSKT